MASGDRHLKHRVANGPCCAGIASGHRRGIFDPVQLVSPVQLAVVLAVCAECVGFVGRTESYTESAPNRFKR